MVGRRRRGRNGNNRSATSNNNNNYNENVNDDLERVLTVVKLDERDRLQLEKKVSDFVLSGEEELLMPSLSNDQRKHLHRFAASMGLKTKSHGKKNNRILRIVRRSRRNPLLGESLKLLLKDDAHRVINQSKDMYAKQWENAQRTLAKAPRHEMSGNQLRGVALQEELGQRMVPPHPNRISNELYKTKKDLPIYQYRENIEQMLRQYSIFIVNGETGSGKTTQVPQYILNNATRTNTPCRIVVTQPRRVAAVSVAQRVADERGEKLGHTVGYQIRLDSRVNPNTNLIYTTSGCLLRSITTDAKDLFSKVTHLIIDEIHERDKYTDFTLITIKEHLRTNPNLKVILMSATMDIESLSRYFACPVLDVPGQGHDVKVYHLEEILYHTGYTTALMKRYLVQMGNTSDLLPCQIMTRQLNAKTLITDEFLQEMLDKTLDHLNALTVSDDEVSELFDQIRYYVESESMPVDAGHSETGFTPLMAACRLNRPQYVQDFMQHSPDVGIRDADGRSAFDYASIHSDGLCMQLLNTFGTVHEQQVLYHQEDAEKQRLLTAYQQQFNDDNDVDHDLISSLIEGLYRRGSKGAIMVFLPGYNDIVQQRQILQSMLPEGTYRLCVLHGQMDSHDQVDVLKPISTRKIILSTNIGQTSITIPDLVYIIDSGKVKMKTYDSITESSQLQSVWISQADANQRAGRAGRTQSGVCYRLFSSAKFASMPKFCVPEFMRIPLTEICLFAKTLESDCPVQEYLERALDPPSRISVQNAIKKLQTLQVFNDDESVTKLGRHLVDMPLDVHLGKTLLYSIFLKCFDPVLTIVAFHSVKDPFILPTDRAMQSQAGYQRKQFSGQSCSDQMGILELYKTYMELRRTRYRLVEFCNRNYLSQSAMELFLATRQQIYDNLTHRYRLGRSVNINSDNWLMVRFCLSAGLYPNVALVDREKNTLISGAEKQLVIQRTSTLSRPGCRNLKDFINEIPHDWIVFYEKSRLGRSCAISMNTVVPAELIALACGKQCDLIEDTYDDSGDSEEDSEIQEVKRSLDALKIRNVNEIQCDSDIIFSLDNWIRFDMAASDAQGLYLLRNLIHTEFQNFLHYGSAMPNCYAPLNLVKFFATLNESGMRNAVIGARL